MSKQRDNIHMSWRVIDGYNKPINIFISPREPGKTDTTWWEKIYCGWLKDKKPWVYLVRQVVEISEAIIVDIEGYFNKWSDSPVTLEYNKGSFKDGIVDVKIKGEIIFRIVALSITLRRIKSAKLPNVKHIFMDEYIIDPRTQEKYLPNEFFKIKELYTTYRREYKGDGVMKIYVCGNPYSLFNPLFVGLKVDTALLRKDRYELVNGEYKLFHNIYVGDNYAIEWGVLHPLLKQKLLEENPFYQFDEEYSNYALEGMAVNDANIPLGKFPSNFSLRYVFKVDRKFIGVFQNNVFDENYRFFVKEIDEVSITRTIYCFDFTELVERCVVLSIDERIKLQKFKEAFRKRNIVFETIECYYFIEEIYKNL